MKKITVLATMTVLALAAAGAAQARQAHAFALVGYHASPNMHEWSSQSRMPPPPTRVWIGFGGPVEYGKSLVFLPSCCTEGWTHHAIQGLFFHELGHVYDATAMTPALRIAFRQSVGVPADWGWEKPIDTIRWVITPGNPGRIIRIAPSEMFAEEYAACALGLTQRGYQDAGYNTYGWLPPEGTDEASLCGLIRSAA